jgi:hypothetical protein
MSKIDLKKSLKTFYSAARNKAVPVNLPPFNFLTLEGEGYPTSSAFQQAAQTLYPLAYTIKFMLRSADPAYDYAVMPMEVIWHITHGASTRYLWKMMIMQPDFVTGEHIQEAFERVRLKGSAPRLDAAQFETFQEGRALQMLHVGAYDQMNATFEQMRTVAAASGETLAPFTHDIYLNNSLKTRPENLRTIMRAQVIV